ncbi:MAG: hypothetical protein M0T79_01990 [Actinomycetota bacterium]|nr:hypothetical protein [Actinomycetota bacterium]
MAEPIRRSKDPVVYALDELVASIHANAEVNKQILRRARQFKLARERGKSWSDITAAEGEPSIIELLRGNQQRLSKSGSYLRRSQAKALREEGLTLDTIARLFGVTRPRIIALLRAADH